MEDKAKTREELLTDTVVPIDNLEDLITAFLVGHVAGANASKDGRLSQLLPRVVAGLPERFLFIKCRVKDFFQSLGINFHKYL